MIRLHSAPREARRLAGAARAHWQRLLDEDASASDLTPLLRLACEVLDRPPARRPIPTPRAAVERSALAADLALARRHTPAAAGRCFGGAAPAVYVAMHAAAAAESAVHLAHACWTALCAHCGLRCIHSRSGRRSPPAWDVLIEHEARHSPADLTAALSAAVAAVAPRRLMLVHAAAAQMPAAFTYSARGGILGSVAHGERLRAHLPAALDAAHFPQADFVSVDLEPLSNGRRRAPNPADDGLGPHHSPGLDEPGLEPHQSPGCFPDPLSPPPRSHAPPRSPHPSRRLLTHTPLLFHTPFLVHTHPLAASSFTRPSPFTHLLSPPPRFPPARPTDLSAPPRFPPARPAGTRGAGAEAAWRAVLAAMGARDPALSTLVAVAEHVRERFAASAAAAAPVWVGCHRDRATERAFSEGPRTAGHTTLACAAACVGYGYFALQV